MKISCLPVSLFAELQTGRMTLKQWAEVAKGIGFDGIDLSMMMILGHTQTYLDGVRRDIDSVGIPAIMATTYPDFTNPDPNQRRRELDFLRRDIALCDELRIPYLRVLAGQAHAGVGKEEGIVLASEYLHQADNIAKTYNVSLLFENHAKPGAWAEIDFSYPLDIFFKIFERIEDTEIRLNFDIGNVVAQGEDPLEVLEKVIDRVETVHVSDMAQVGKFSPTEIGTGVCPIPQVLKRLKVFGFNGWVCIEEASGHRVRGIQNAWAYVRGVIDQL